MARGIGPTRFFGLTRLQWQRVVAISLPLFIAMVPLVMAAYTGSLFVCEALNFHPPAAPALFWEIAGLSQRTAGTMQFLGVLLIAPVTEEVLHRGYLYPVLKPRLGPIGSALFTAALFAAVHLNVPAFAPLFVTSLSLTIAYETTGCLLVPVVMHILANGANLLLHWPPA
jgi:membrane protease YdiL (CAAX protease family)